MNTDSPAPGRMRSALFAPATRVDFIRKLPSRGADLVILDCEDAVPAAEKASAREIARGEIPALRAGSVAVMVRVNPPDTPWFVADVAALVDTGLTGLVVPKVQSVAALDALTSVPGIGANRLFIGLESALGVADARALLCHPLVGGGYFGAEDFVADLGGVRRADNQEVLYARSRIALAGRIADVPVLDQVVTDFRDAVRFKAEAEQARALGFAGKLCIHPAQVPIANAAFCPSEEEIAAARRLLQAFDLAVEEGRAAIEFEGQMVDEALAVQARRLLEL